MLTIRTGRVRIVTVRLLRGNDMVGDIKDSINHAIKERLNSPILGSYIIFFTLFHWETWVLLFWSNKTGNEKINELKSIWPTNLDDFLYPLIITFVFVTLYPLVKLAYHLFIQVVDVIQVKYESILSSKTDEIKTKNFKKKMEFHRIKIDSIKEKGVRHPNETQLLLQILKETAEHNSFDQDIRDKLVQISTIVPSEPQSNNGN